MQKGISASKCFSDKSQVFDCVICDICPHFCELNVSDIGKCRVIKNIAGVARNIYEGECSNIAVEPIEKKPFFHFLPASKFLSVGFYGCNFKCGFCQNFTVSQQINKVHKKYSPSELVELAIHKNVSGIAFTYNEPTIFHKYIEEVGYLIEKNSLFLKLVLKTNGFSSYKTVRDLCVYAHAINIDIKGDDQDYGTICGGWLKPVLDNIELVYDMECHLEINYLVMPSKIKDTSFNTYIRDFIADIDESIPVHILHFYPFHRMPEIAYEPTELLSIIRLFSERLRYVYISNSFHPGLTAYRNTVCPSCGKVLINRVRSVSVIKIKCCGVEIFGTF